MALNPNEFTDKVNKIIYEATNLAITNKNPQVEPSHIATVLFEDPEGMAKRVAQKAGADIDQIQAQLRELLQRIPQQDPAPLDASFSSNSRRLLQNAQKHQRKNSEAHLAVDHVLLALVQEKAILQILAQNNLAKSDFENVLKKVKGARTADSKGAEGNYDALGKYGTDLVQQAADGKLDPVLGRDEEIRRVIQILARRVKSNPCLVGAPGTACPSFVVL